MEKENAIKNFFEMTKKSWTYGKLTEEEKLQFEKTLEAVPVQEAIKGTYNQRWKVLQAVYMAFLNGCGYNDFNWREERQ